MASLEQLLSLLAEPKSSVQLQEHLGVSQATVSRLLRRAGERVVRLGAGPTTRYVASHDVFDVQSTAKLFSVNDRGVVGELAVLRALADGRYLVEGRDLPKWLRGESDTGLFEDLPYFLYDLKPSGFLGRQIARRLSRVEEVPSDPRVWTNQHIGQYLLRHADDLPGNLVVGELAAKRVNAMAIEVVDDRATEYPRLAQRALGDDPPGSSAAGEQPKFAVYQRDAGHVIVKFSPSSRSPEARRWRDLLRAECHALAVLSECKLPTADASIFEFEGRVFLESRRFDRVRRKGRCPAISLTMIDAEFAGEAYGWSQVGQALGKAGLLDDGDVGVMVWAETFGSWIGNTDMHLGNVSLAPTGEGFELLPLYDMLPMAFAPVRGELAQPRLSAPLRTAINDSVWAEAGHAAVEFWERVAADGEVSPAMKRIAVHQARRCSDVL